MWNYGMHGIIHAAMMMKRMSWWENDKKLLHHVRERYEVDPLLFVGIHVVATPFIRRRCMVDRV
jgi:hypothetical protein